MAVPPRLLISGYYGFGNFGDEAILRVFVDEWRRRRPADSLVVLSARPEATAATYDIEALARANWPVVRSAIAGADVVVSGAGGLLQSATSLRSLLYYTGIVAEARRRKRKTAIWAQGIGPLSWIGRQIVRRTCAGVDLACVRDETSRDLLAPLLPGVDVRIAADPVFLASTNASSEAQAQLAREGIAGSAELVVVAVRRGRVLNRTIGAIASLVDRLSDHFGVQAVFVPLQSPQDAQAAAAVIRRCRSAPVLLGGGYDLAAVIALLRRASAVISMRLHAIILAARLGIPFVAVPHDPKITALCDSLAYPLAPLRREADAVALADRLWSQRDALCEHLLRATPPLAARAARAFDWLEELTARIEP